MANEKILVIEDEQEISDLISDYLEINNYKVYRAYNGNEGLEIFNSSNPDLIILDLMLPGIDGFELCKKIRKQSSIPIIILSARREDVDKVLGLGLGADDYVTKPFSPSELIARIKAQLRRSMMNTDSRQDHIMDFGRLKIDLKGYNVLLNGEQLLLPAKEFELLSFLATNAGQVFTKEQLFNNIWGFDDFGDINTVTVHIRRLREKIEENPSNPKLIVTVWGVGYKFEGDRK
ncbi:transcriptional regulatory protein YycF [Oxobacter pfennigii]|uniref:Stage 0 sporulation protein A homolog n=1 Tax=Oxobacter pfennigii TaxID=36849 RepID=A0A0P8YWU7_9CLOT|nr:transcriptional regulatory protein YycF [Oxobacter pfennigii]